MELYFIAIFMISLEIGGALKNPLAIGAGIIEGF
jgi:glycerol-3-phosphate dehydrogenase